MKNKPEPMRTTDELPTFLDNDAGDTAGEARTDPTPGDVEDAAASPGADETLASDELAPGDAPTGGGADGATAPEDAAAAPRQDHGRQVLRPAMGGGLATVLGIVALLGAPAAIFLPAFAANGFTPNHLFVLGTLLVAAGMTQRHVGRLQQRLDEAENRRREESHAVQQNLRHLVDESHREKAPAQGEELQHVLMSLQRQDEKINNLTKAIKMYGKPLMEISGQGTEFASSLATMKTLIEGGTESNRQAINRLEAQVRAATASKELAELLGAVQKLQSRVEASAGKTPTISLEPLQQHLGRLEVGLAAMAQRLEDSEVRKSLLRLEDAVQKGRDAVQELLKGDSVRQATTQLQNRVDSATRGLAEGLAQLREGNLGGLENAVREIQREVAGVATTVAQINAAMKGGTRVAAAPAATTANAAPTSAPAPAPEPAPTKAPAAAGEASGAYQTGTRTSGGKNVLGAIAKLKQMKG